MRQSSLFGKTLREVPKQAGNKSTEYLLRGGFIAESTAGRYYLLPLGMRVHDRIMRIVEKEMDALGGQKMISPTLHPIELWKETNRTASAGFELMGVKDRRGAEFVLGGTAEEMFVDLVRRYTLSYRDLPFILYQFSQKFRDEMRARGGLLRVREFMMKDAYSFHRDETNFKETYAALWQAYERMFQAVGLKVFVAESDNGYIGGEYCHEFIVESPVGESTVLITDDGTYAAHQDVAVFDRGHMNPKEKVKDMETITQPEWVQTMEDNEKHYGEPRWRYLKNVVYRRHGTNEVIIAVIRGDLEVNKAKVEHALNVVGQLEDATADDLAKIGTKTGYVHSWGHSAKYIGDLSLESVINFIGGQKDAKNDTTNVNYGRDFQCDQLADIAMAKAGHTTKKGETLRELTGIEVGNIFQLGTHYSSLMQAVFADEDGLNKQYYMGCYGIGIGRTLATIVEKYHDENGILWPHTVAPFAVHLISLCRDEKEVSQANALYQQLTQQRIEVLYDDRTSVRAGEKFADSDLIGIPVRLILSPKTLEKNSVEMKGRATDKTELVLLTDVMKVMGESLK